MSTKVAISQFKSHCLEIIEKLQINGQSVIITKRNKEIVRYFSERPDDLLVIDITKEKTTKKIVNFLELPSKLITKMPHLNKT
jgi:hypothetical protein